MSTPPRCNMCKKPAWLRVSGAGNGAQQTYGSYCGSTNCTSRERLCQRCGEEFTIGINGAGTKYCSVDCRGWAYRPGTYILTRLDNLCAWCKKPGSRRHPKNSPWPYICKECIEPIKHVAHLFKDHRVPQEKAREFAANPECAICKRDLLTKHPDRYSGKLRSALVIDHDHSCCPTGKSCGACARGPLCNRCNQAIGLFLEDTTHLESAIQYLKNPPWRQQ